MLFGALFIAPSKLRTSFRDQEAGAKIRLAVTHNRRIDAGRSQLMSRFFSVKSCLCDIAFGAPYFVPVYIARVLPLHAPRHALPSISQNRPI